MAPGRNEDCWCGSKRKYKHCHHDIDNAPDDQKYETAQRVYSTNWTVTARKHSENGVYDWLASQLVSRAPKRILDIGCGSGHGLVAMREVLGNDVRIVAVDENRACLDSARDTLHRQGVAAQVVHRMTVSQTPTGFNHVAGPLSFDADSACTLIESDICNDPFLTSALLDSGQFDAVTIWLTGVHMLRQFNVNVMENDINSDATHRLYVQNAAYELADAVLHPGGILQVGDRGQTPDTPLLEADLLQAHSHQASVTSLEVKSLAHCPYNEPGQRRTPMVFTPGSAGLIPDKLELAIISVVSEKPQ
ncbi:methyltransferase domain-containing protein [Parasphingorhabdus flavimaris]|jgi:SAM-dependent methyltransferase|uniref:Methyltransferase domain-containing protein n=1 Tax=Parasphingorhabdus flavimaris TaxID=266812 RepID=A0ABX2N0H4_9SPHN|nr:methyltransferase domain-containing protein [Parasphingorhabdus flavimaris]NVD27196.1 methyltransferase domain-containing protein [Parasphingorhabdus flavimaris]